jgi:flagellar biogenesis protein FliO
MKRHTQLIALLDILQRFWRSALRRVRAQRDGGNLHLRETLSLGEKRFVAVVEVNHQRFLIGGTANSIALLARLQRKPQPEFATLLQECSSSRVM